MKGVRVHVTLAPARRAVAQESAAEQFARGVDYQHGAGVPRDARTAAEWYRKAAAQGHVQAQVNLAIMYLSGDVSNRTKRPRRSGSPGQPSRTIRLPN